MTSPRFTPRGGPPKGDCVTGGQAFGATRRYRGHWMDSEGALRDAERTVPATPLFDAAHSAFVRGTLITTPSGPVAIEDLFPGDTVVTAAQGPQSVLWIGSMTLPVPETNGPSCRLTRIMTDAFGMMRPMSDLMVGPGARFLSHPRHLRARCGADPVLTPARAMTDGMQIFEVSPNRPVTLYHLCLETHAIITANGLQAESFHPGAGFERGLDAPTLETFLSFFPHIRAPGDFGPLAHMRLPLDTPDALTL